MNPMKTTLRLVTATLISLLLAAPAAAQSTDDLVRGLAELLNGSVADADRVLVWEAVPEAAATEEGPDDLYLVEGGTPSDPPAFVDLLQGVEFGFAYPRDTYRALFDEGGPLACGSPGVTCPTYETTTDPFRRGAFAVGFRLAAAAEPTGAETLTVAVLTHDDDFPTFEDPRPASPFVGTNEAWRLDLTEGQASLRYFLVVTGAYQEFHTDARVLLDGDRGWFLIPAGEFALEGTIVGFDVHSFFSPAPDAEPSTQAADSGPQGELARPVGQTGSLAIAEVSEPSPSPSPTASPSPVASPTPSTATSAGGGGSTIWLILIVVAVVVVLIGLALMLWPGLATTAGSPPIVVKEKGKRRIRRQVEIDTAVEISDESRLQTVVETVEEEVEVPKEPQPEPEPPRPPEPPEEPPQVDVGDLTEVTPGPGTLEGVPTGIGIAETRPETPCMEEYRAWKSAEAACEAARRAAEEAEARAEAAREELDRLRREYRPLGFTQSDSTVIETDDGMRMSDLDAALLGWDSSARPQPSRPRSPAERVKQTKERLERLRQEYARFKALEAELKAKLAEADRAAREARAAADEACARAEAAHRAWLECIGAGAPGGPAAGGGPPPGGEPPRPPEQPRPPEPPEPPKEPEEPGPPEQPEKPKPSKPAPPRPLEGPKPPPGGGGELPRGECREGDTRETDVETLVIETLRRRGRAKLTISGGLELEGPPVQVLLDAKAWVGGFSEETRSASTLYTLSIKLQMERIVARCFRLERCVGGRWTSGPRQKQISDPEYFDRNFVHRESLNAAELARALERARNDLTNIDRKREALDTFCPDAVSFERPV